MSRAVVFQQPVRLTDAAEGDFQDILRWTVAHFGEAQARTYAETLSAAIEALAVGPTIPGATQRQDIAKGLMTLHVQVTRITKPHRPHEHITHHGHPPTWLWTREQVIASIEANTNMFYVKDPRTGKRAYVGVIRPVGRAPYVQTHADGVGTTIYCR